MASSFIPSSEKYYKDELRAILDKQKEFIPELTDEDLLRKCSEELYRHNDGHRSIVERQDFTHLFVDDIIFYQRPLKSKKSLIADCPLEYYPYKKDGVWMHRPIKCTPRSNPIFQEFRLWKFIQDLRIYKREDEVDGRLVLDVDVTSRFFSSPEDYCQLFDWLKEKSEITQKQFLAYPAFHLGKDAKKYRWNNVDDDKRAYPLCPTHYDICKALKDVDGTPVLSTEQEQQLWHILYSVDDRFELEKGLRHFAEKNQLEVDSFAQSFIKMKAFNKDYANYSEKAYRRMLPLMRTGRYWNADNIDARTMHRIQHLVNGEADDSISNRVREKCAKLDALEKYISSCLIGWFVMWSTTVILRRPIINDGLRQKILTSTLEKNCARGHSAILWWRVSCRSHCVWCGTFGRPTVSPMRCM